MTDSRVVTPTIRRASRRSLFWILAVVFLLILAVVSLATAGSTRTAGTRYSATNPSPIGSKAIAEVLRQQGVTVHSTRALATADAELRAHSGSTLMLVDRDGYLDAEQLQHLAGLARHVVLLAPTFTELSALTPEIGQAGKVGKQALTSGCDLPAAERAGTVGGTGFGYRLIDTAGPATECFGSGDGVHSLIEVSRGDRRISVVGTTDVFTNEHVIERGNAALALNLLGGQKQLVWYLPTIADAAVAGAPTLAQLTPPWVSPVLVLLVIAAIAAMIWRGRRFGPLVIENLPVVVRASETMEGRARLYQRGAARLRALDSLRLGAISRLAAACGLSHAASVEEVVSAVAGLLGRDVAGIRSVLIDSVPATDGELVALSDRLLEIERSVASSLRSGG